jgi:hypothetical protein
MAETIGTAVVKVIADGDGFADDAERQIRAKGKDFEKAGEEVGKKFRSGMNKNGDKDTDRLMGRIRNKLLSHSKKFEDAGSKLGRAFGRGSRNDLVNAFGGFVALPLKLISSVGKGLAGVAGKFSDFGERIQELGGGFSGLAKAAGEGVLKEGLPGLAIAAGVIKVFTSSLGALASALVLVAGLALALAGSLAFAVVGGLVAVAGALVPFAAMIGVAALAMSDLDKKSQAFKDMKKNWDDLKKGVSEKLFGKDMGGLSVISGLLKTIKPLIDGVATAMGGLLREFGKATQSKGFQTMMSDIAKSLPGMVTQLGHVAGNIGTFLGEAFVAAGPIIEEFLGWLEDVTGKLADFGKGGKDSGLAKFFQDAWDSAKIVGGLIQEIALAIGDLFGAGKDTGDSIFVSLTDAVKDFRKWLKGAQEDGSLQQMFDDAEKLAGEIGDIIVAVGDLIGALDTPGNRGLLFDLLDIIEGLIKGITWVVTKVDEVSTAIMQFGLDAGEWFSGLSDAPDKVAGFFEGLPARITGFFSGLGTKIVTAAGNLATSFATWISGIWATISAVPGQILTFFSGLATRIITAAGNLAVAFGVWLAGLPAQVITVTGQIIVSMINLAGRMILAAGSILGAFTQWLADLPGVAAQAVVNITVGFINLAIKIFQRAGNLATQFGIWISGVPGKLRALAQSLPGFFSGLASKLIAKAGSLASRFASWVASLPGKARAIAAQAAAAFAGLAGKIIARAGSIAGRFASWVASLPGKARSIAQQIANAFSGLATKAIAKAGSITAAIGRWASGVYSAAKGVANDIVRAFSGLASDIVAAIGTIVPKISMPHITVPHITAIVDKPKAAGGIATSPTYGLYGEAGPEAIVPLSRPLSQVDPAVRMLSAFAQGKLKFPAAVGGTGKTIDVGGITINTPTEDPRAVASEVVAHMAAAAYI